MKGYIERNAIQVGVIQYRKNRDFIADGNVEVGIYFRDRRAHPRRVVSGQRAPAAPDVSAHDHFGTRHFGT